MDVRIARGPTRWGARALVAGLATLIVAIAIGAAEFAQAPTTAQPKAAANGPPADSAARPKAGAPAAEVQPAADPQQPQLSYSPWTKLCIKGQEANAQQVCFTGTVGRVESGVPVVAAVLIEPEDQAKRCSVSLCRSACVSHRAPGSFSIKVSR